MIKTCPTCRKPNCGNWSACARRASVAAAASKTPATDKVALLMLLGRMAESERRLRWAEKWITAWGLICQVERELGSLLDDIGEVKEIKDAGFANARAMILESPAMLAEFRCKVYGAILDGMPKSDSTMIRKYFLDLGISFPYVLPAL